ncbi:cobalamin (vitamin B12) biosynthesis CbiG protein [Methanocaldococcus vulcanius M7]|uniref:Cobalamin (Vitamin B12) biosynthesis CbiG protein n=1 Tax=Methanocaldococcus vulcanius (strain ATCC 700851 / DSM 12094 / M7) TaxID=579137 RepID=C9RG62_METVM|nr:cobalamin biosynthesis protein [Methanocaldococcus vulcanius]ACX72564.1 cobalamin (vitamin B12) biosynthesis CbiG protein [Methanocaldococcus vulcanius M7]
MIKIIYITKSGKKISNEIENALKYYQYECKAINIKNFSLEREDEGFIFICAMGIVLRKYIDKIKKDKFKDPFVIVCNEKKEIIPILSNHLGGGNYFSKLIAKEINGKVVYTTATDVSGKIGIDELSKMLFLEIPKRKDILKINKKILEEDVSLTLPNTWKIKDIPGYLIKYHDEEFVLIDDSIKLKPLKLCVGLGARKGIKRYKVFWAVKKALYLRGIPTWRVDAFATVEDKKEEKGIVETVKKFKKPLFIFKKDEINELYKKEDLNIERSNFVFEHLGVYGVSEPVSILAVKKLANVDIGNIDLILRKFKKDGTTVAISVENSG